MSDMSAAKDSNIPKIMHWATPRSRATVFMWSMMTNPNIKALLEPYSMPYYFGADRISSRYNDNVKSDTSGSLSKWTSQTFEGVKATLEGNYNDKEAVFAKDLAYSIWQHPSNTSLLPDGYIHTFQIRHPRNAVPSLYKVSLNKSESGWDYFNPQEVGFKELRQLYDYVTTVLGQEAIIIDGDDLATHPESIIKQYCQKTGLRYLDTMIDWSDCPIQDKSVFEGWESWLQAIFSSKRFIRPSSEKPVSADSLPEIVQQCINDALPHYEHMHARRILP